MIKLIAKGVYRIAVTEDRKRMLYLDDQGYLWTYAKGIGHLLSFSKHVHESQYILAQGKYKIYQVNKEPKYVDLQHLELSLDSHTKQGYLLLTGLPTKAKIRSRIIPTDEVIGLT